MSDAEHSNDHRIAESNDHDNEHAGETGKFARAVGRGFGKLCQAVTKLGYGISKAAEYTGKAMNYAVHHGAEWVLPKIITVPAAYAGRKLYRGLHHTAEFVHDFPNDFMEGYREGFQKQMGLRDENEKPAADESADYASAQADDQTASDHAATDDRNTANDHNFDSDAAVTSDTGIAGFKTADEAFEYIDDQIDHFAESAADRYATPQEVKQGALHYAHNMMAGYHHQLTEETNNTELTAAESEALRSKQEQADQAEERLANLIYKFVYPEEHPELSPTVDIKGIVRRCRAINETTDAAAVAFTAASGAPVGVPSETDAATSANAALTDHTAVAASAALTDDTSANAAATLTDDTAAAAELEAKPVGAAANTE